MFNGFRKNFQSNPNWKKNHWLKTKQNWKNVKMDSFTRCRALPSLIKKNLFRCNAYICVFRIKTNGTAPTLSALYLPSKRFRYQNKTKRFNCIAFILYRAEDVEDQCTLTHNAHSPHATRTVRRRVQAHNTEHTVAAVVPPLECMWRGKICYWML